MNISGFRQEYGKYVMDNFEFELGTSLEDVAVEYSMMGRPVYDEEGNITNAVVFFHGFNGNHSSLNSFRKFLDEDEDLDINDYFIISLTTLGFPDSCSPSSTGLKHHFPNYTILDRVNFKRQFLKEFLDIEKVHGLVGWGIGGYEILTWAATYPDEMDFLVVLATSFKTDGHRYIISKCIESFIESNEDFYSDVYNESLSQMMVSINKLLYSNYFSKKTFHSMTNDEIDVFMDDFVDAGLFMDVHDFKFRNDAILDYNIEDELKNIKAETLIISSKDDIYYVPEFDAIPLSNLIEHSKLILFDSKRDYHDVEDFSVLETDVSEFIKDLKK